jgi:hypothetical protein
VTTETIYPRWIQAGDHDMRVELGFNRFVDYARSSAGVWRQKTYEMTDKQSVTPERHQIGDRPDLAALNGREPWPLVDPEMTAWLETTHREVRR